MNKIFSMILGAAVVAPLFLSAPAQAQSYNDIQRMEEQVQEAKNRGDWGYAQDLERQLNVARLAYQRQHGLGENQQSGYYNNGYYNNGYYNNNNGYYNNNRYYYDRGNSRYHRQDRYHRRGW